MSKAGLALHTVQLPDEEDDNWDLGEKLLDCSDSGDDDFVDVQASFKDLKQQEDLVGREWTSENTEDAVPLEKMVDDGFRRSGHGSLTLKLLIFSRRPPP